nr:MAG TPA: hypothetical protein [Caudoviricetes sp.]
MVSPHEHPDSSSFSKDRLVSISYSHILYTSKNTKNNRGELTPLLLITYHF